MTISQIVSAISGLPQDQVKLVLGNLCCIPLSYIIPDFPTSQSRAAYSLIMGIILNIYIFGDYPKQLAAIFFLSLGTYLFIKHHRQNCGKYVTIGSILILSGYHIYRLVTDYGSWVVDTTTILMMIICKYSAFAYAYEDGMKDPETLSREQREFRLTELPSIFDYFSYLLFLPTAAMGPSLEYSQYFNYINLTKQYSNIPNRLPVMWNTFKESMLYLLIYLVVYIPFLNLEYLKTDDFLSRSLPYNFIVAWLSITFLRTKYYFAFKLCSCCVDASGISYGGTIINKDGKEEQDWSQIATVNVSEVEKSIHIREKIKNWNISVQIWLMRCVYYRYGSVELYKKDKKAMSRGQLLVFMVSAFWHGFYVGYYISFFFWHQLTALAYCVFRISQNRADLVKKYEESGFAGHLLLWFLVSWAFSYFGATFLLMSSGACIRFMASTYFLPYIAVLVLVFVLQRSPMVRGPRPTAKTE